MKKISLILVTIMLFGTLTACKSQKGISSDSSLIDSGTLSYSSSEHTSNTSENQSSESSEANAASSQPSAPNKVESNTSSDKTLPSKNNTSVDTTSGVTTGSSNITSTTNRVPNNDNTSSATNSSESQKTENKIETRIYKNDVFSIEVPASLDGKYSVTYHSDSRNEFGYYKIDLCIDGVDYGYVAAQMSFIVSKFDIVPNVDDCYIEYLDNEEYCIRKRVSQKSDWFAEVMTTENKIFVDPYEPNAMENYDAVFAQKDFIISSFKWLI